MTKTYFFVCFTVPLYQMISEKISLPCLTVSVLGSLISNEHALITWINVLLKHLGIRNLGFYESYFLAQKHGYTWFIKL